MPTRKLSPSQDSWHSLGKWRGVCPPAPQVFVSLSLSSQAHSSRLCQTHTPSAPTAGCDHHLPPTSGPGLSRPLVASGRSVLGAPGLWTPLWRGPGLRAVASCAVHSGAVPLCAGGTVTFFLVAGDGFGSRMGGCLPNSRVQCLRQVGVLCAGRRVLLPRFQFPLVSSTGCVSGGLLRKKGAVVWNLKMKVEGRAEVKGGRRATDWWHGSCPERYYDGFTGISGTPHLPQEPGEVVWVVG